jgi:hypothetical protein
MAARTSTESGRQGRRLALTIVLLAGTAVLLLGEGRAVAQKVGMRDQPAPRKGKHCLGDQESKLILEHYDVGSINPLGLENQLRLSLCIPLIETPGLLYDFTNVEFGLANYISPTHVHGGVFATVTPLSFLTLKAEVTGFYIWPLDNTVFPGAGVINLPEPDCRASYNDIYPPAGTTGLMGGNGYGVRTLLGASLQGSVPLGKRLDLLVYDGLSTEYWRYNTDACVFVSRRDVGIHGSGDWIIANTAVLALAIKVRPNHTIRLGATDDLVHTPSNGYLGNIAAALISYGVDNLRGLARSFSAFVRMGGFTNGFRKDGPDPLNQLSGGSLLTLAIGLDVYYELIKRPTRRAVQQQNEVAPPPAEPTAPAPDSGTAPPPPATPTAPAADPAAAPASEVH